ncbi:tail fiber assembly protein [Neptuniibacter sp.]|uniref:tail fiber assembly protein n=1 Tax=Neptuniibacter sp. TaxID=1962643 RepID=UPI00261D30D3|nr:tail fiber assembly protein [Neptuniibacter sp.]MCP4597802.1 hypothetical protein [Neptuniibacter sp.]
MKYVTYLTATGEITGHGSTKCALNQKALMPGESIMQGEGMPETHQVIDGQIVKRTVPANELNQKALSKLRHLRNARLKESDFSQLPDAPIASNQAWKDYRQELRNLPQTFSQITDIEDVVWPIRPE